MNTFDLDFLSNVSEKTTSEINGEQSLYDYIRNKVTHPINCEVHTFCIRNVSRTEGLTHIFWSDNYINAVPLGLIDE